MLALAAMLAALAAAPVATAQTRSGTTITVFEADADGDAEPIRVIRGLLAPEVMAVDRRGRLYVTRGPLSAGDDTIRVFAPDADGDAPPERIIAGPNTGLDQPTGLAIDSKGQLYVANGGRSARKRGYEQGRESGLEAGITVYGPEAAGDASPIGTLAGGLVPDEGFLPHRLTFGRRDSLFVKTTALLAVFAPGATGASVPARLIVQHIPRPPGGKWGTSRSPERFVLDQYDSMYVLSGDTIMVYPPGYTMKEPESRRIAGPRTGIHSATDLALDDRGWLYVADRDSSLVKVFAPGATGDVAPARRIGGPRSRLFAPGTLLLDRKRRLYVANLPFRNFIQFR